MERTWEKRRGDREGTQEEEERGGARQEERSEGASSAKTGSGGEEEVSRRGFGEAGLKRSKLGQAIMGPKDVPNLYGRARWKTRAGRGRGGASEGLLLEVGKEGERGGSG